MEKCEKLGFRMTVCKVLVVIYFTVVCWCHTLHWRS